MCIAIAVKKAFADDKKVDCLELHPSHIDVKRDLLCKGKPCARGFALLRIAAMRTVLRLRGKTYSIFTPSDDQVIGGRAVPASISLKAYIISPVFLGPRRIGTVGATSQHDAHGVFNHRRCLRSRVC